jgi:acylpyruvate hydrolase
MSRLHLETGDGFVSVETLATMLDQPQLSGLRDAADLYRRGDEAVAALRDASLAGAPRIAFGEARLAAPVQRPGKIICVGLNYVAHIEESNLARPTHIVLFSKYASCIVAHGEPIVLPPITSKLDYEGELAVVIGKRAKRVCAADALSYVGGYTIINDVSARDLQGAEPQWLRGKCLDTFAPLGPVIVDAQAAPAIDDMHIRTFINGEVRQDAPCSLMITSVPELIEHISAGITLEPGDIIATGTPSGVAAEADDPVFLSDGDVVDVEIEGLGRLSNPVVAAR